MSYKSNFDIVKTYGSVVQFLRHSCQTKNLMALKLLHAHLLRKSSLFFSPYLHAQLIFCYTTYPCKNNLKTLTSCLKFIHPKNPMPFNVLISEYCRNGFAFYAIKTLSLMHSETVPLDTYALCSSITAASSIQSLDFGKQIHAHVTKLGWLSSVFVGSALIDLYAKRSFVGDAVMLFEELPEKNTVCANGLLSGYGETKLWVQGLEFFRKMPSLDLDYDNYTLLATLRSCAGLSAIELGRQVHAYVVRKFYDLESDVFLQSSLIEMYGKCGSVRNAFQVFGLAGFRVRGRRTRDIVVWTSMLGVYGRNGHYSEVVELFKEMLNEGIKPDGVAFVTVISACGHTGQVDLGIEYFESMTGNFELSPGPEHYSCVVDLLCRAGRLDKAWKLVNEMLPEGEESLSASLWGPLVSACEEHGNIELGKLAAQRALKLEPKNVGIYVMLSNLYARFGKWDELSELRDLMQQRGIKKEAGSSWIELR
ncbi:hypothetical protein K2173_018115 [Erythroxylum novogranatense]|uniref:Pentatricopeptide repeat-containing protein n=1 Tax=Erythroxylum novogranatense TaxID=1862640 RepID=A0AAV8U7I9_9ROSI|nr:hypothetical protein K2173_018115 [Erythroxylum novogranatense]